MVTPTKAEVKRILGALKRSKKKVISLDALSRLAGLYPDVLGNTLAYFDPMILMDASINVRDLVPAMEEYVNHGSSPLSPKKPREKKETISKKELASYASVTDFVYKKMTTVGGLVDPSYALSDHDLRVLAKLIVKEESRRKKKQSH